MQRRTLFILALILALVFAHTTLIYAEGIPGGKLIEGSEKDAISLTCGGNFAVGEEQRILIKVYDKKFVHSKDGDDVVYFLVFHRYKPDLGKGIRDQTASTVDVSGGYAELAKVKLQKIGSSRWMGFVRVCRQESTFKVAVWDKKTTPDNYFSVRVKTEAEKELEKAKKKNERKAEIIGLANQKPSLEEIVEEIRTPEELVIFMSHHFESKFHEGHHAYSPQEFLTKGHGNCKDWAVFAGYYLKEKGYKAKQISYSTVEWKGAHRIILYWNKGKVYYMSTGEGGTMKLFGPYQDIEGVLKNEEKRSGGEINCYELGGPTQPSIEKPCLFE